MTFKYVVAVVRTSALELLESELRRMRVGGITLTRVKGLGEYKNFFTNDLLSDHTKVEIFVEDLKVEDVVSALHATASDLPGAGIVAVVSTERFLHFAPNRDTARRAGPDTSRCGRPYGRTCYVNAAGREDGDGVS